MKHTSCWDTYGGPSRQPESKHLFVFNFNLKNEFIIFIHYKHVQNFGKQRMKSWICAYCGL